MRRGLSLLLVLTLALVGCGDSDDEGGVSTSTAANMTTAATTSTTISTPVETTASQPTATATTGLAGPIVYGPTVLVEGWEECRLDPMVRQPTVTTDPDGTVLFRDGRFECTVTNSDPRVAGTAYHTLNMNRWATTKGSQVAWGTVRIENEGGVWESVEGVAVYTSEWGDVFTALFRGTGDYGGLAYYLWAVETFGPTWPTKGLIFPTDTGPPPELLGIQAQPNP